MKEILQIIDSVQNEELKLKLAFIYGQVKIEYDTKPSSTKYHHVEKGGMGRHVKEVMNIALEMYDAHSDWYECTRDDVIVTAFVHDFNKLYKYVPSELWMQQAKYGGRLFMYDEKKLRLNETAETVMYCAQWGLVLDPLYVNAISFHHGGFSADLSSVNKVGSGEAMSPLAVLLHSADLISGFIMGRVPDASKP